MNNSFAIVVPMFNEESGALHCIEAITHVLNQNPGSVLIAVNDASSDRTGEILQEAANRFPNLIIITHPKNLGYGAALQTGGRKALEEGYSAAIFMDSDLTNDPGFIPVFVERLTLGCD